ncbi:MAG: hypothetical protein OEZ07_03120 [Dehalococcoidia bacterium]|nr:hypothetical protein [Dehalococcoidia bacterium]MDH5781543.1 hypothetical protein [Dehalococcoidia bacterium]
MLEELVKKLVALAGKAVLTKVEHKEAQELMRQLKEAGMSNEEISKLSHGKWTPSTVKFYTKGIKSAHPNQWESSVALLDKLISSGFTLDDVETAVTISEDLKSHGVSLDNVIELLLAADSSSLEVADLAHQHELFKEYGLSPKKVSEALSLNEELEKKGLGLDSLVPLVELAKNYGEAQKIIEALSKYASLSELSEQVDSANGELESLNQQIGEKRQQVKEAETKLTKLKEPIEAYAKVIDLGFTKDELVKLSSIADKYGGVKKFLEAVDAYQNYSGILNKITKAEARLAEIEAGTSKLDTHYAHLKTATTMCEALMEQYKFGLDAITTILAAAKKYGEPLDVLKAIEAYGKLQALQLALAKLEGEVAERKELLAQVEGKCEGALDQLESLNATALKTGAEVAKAETQLANSKEVQKLLNVVNNPASAEYKEYGPLVLAIATSIHKWLLNNEHRFKFAHSIKSGLDNLIAELGGD